MFLENEFNGTLTFLHILIALFFGIAPVAVTIAIKVALYRRRLAEDETCQHDEASACMERSSGGLKLRQDRRRIRLVRALPPSFRANQPLALFVTKPHEASRREPTETDDETDKGTLAA